MSAPPYRVKAVYDYKSPHADDLDFPNGQVITVIEEEDADWYVGQYVDDTGTKHEGLFPKNFVERMEPEAPPRPVRTRTKRESTITTQAPVEVQEPTPEAPPFISQAEVVPPPAPRLEPVERAPASVVQHAPEPKPEAPKPAPAAKAAPPPVAEKPSSFKDRIAAFNKSSQAPLAPTKPSGPPGGFIKKPFVAPPPARDSYVPPPREHVPPPKVYRREEDPEVVEQQAQDQENAERAGLVVNESAETVDDAPKTSLKERIALLQKQQQEQAGRRTEVSSKEKSNRPTKKRTGSTDTANTVTSREGEDAEHTGSRSSAQRTSMDSSYDSPRPPPARRISRDPRSPELLARDSARDENDQDISGAGETEEPESMHTEIEEHGERMITHPNPLSRTSTITAQPMSQPVEDVQEETEEEDEIDAETRRRMELRQRMAKMSGGMGMPGMFGGGMPMPGPAPKKPQPVDISDRRGISEGPTTPIVTQRMPMVPIPGMQDASEFRAEGRPVVGKEPEHERPFTANRDPEEVPDVEDLRPMPAVPQHMAVPPSPQGTTKESNVSIQHSSSHVEMSTPLSNDSNARWSYVVYDHEQEKYLKVDVFKRPVPSAPGTSQRPMPAPPSAPRPVPVPSVAMDAQIPAQPQNRAVPPPPVPRELQRPDAGSESDDELSSHHEPSGIYEGPAPPPHGFPVQTVAPPPPNRNLPLGPAPPPPHRELPIRAAPPPIPITPSSPMRSDGPRSPTSPNAARMSYFSNAPTSPIAGSPPAVLERRISRGPPPIPLGSPTMLPHGDTVRLPPPPPPPTAIPQRVYPSVLETGGIDEHGESEYEGDYDTDLGPGEAHRDAVRPNARISGLPEASYPEELSMRLPVQGPPNLPPPVPMVQRGAPPPPPHQAGGIRQSIDSPRAAPPAPPHRDFPAEQHDDYDPYSYSGPVHGLPVAPATAAPPPPPLASPIIQESNPILYAGPAPRRPTERAPPPAPQGPPPPSHDRAVPPPPPSGMAPLQPPPQRMSRDLNRQSVELPSSVSAIPRRSTEIARPVGEQGQMARDVDLAFASNWWAQSNAPPPVFQKRGDILFEVEETSSTKRGGRTTVSKDVYVLFPDYSQTIVTARFDAKDPSDVNLEQRHQSPPHALRQEQLESAHRKFGNTIATTAAAKHNSTLGDGSPQAMILEVLRAVPTALLPVGTRAYGALIYSNIANSSVTQHDEIRPGDIITFRNAKFQGKHGAMHAKYSLDVGRPEHVGIVTEWDGTKKKVRAWEQGRENKKVKMESFKVGDLRSGEVKVWRVMGRDWVGWEGSN